MEKLKFRVMVTSLDLLLEEINHHNSSRGTDFKIVRVIDDEVPFCDIEATTYSMSDIFDLGFGLALYEEKLRKEGKIDW